jgi:hypothetical protein
MPDERQVEARRARARAGARAGAIGTCLRPSPGGGATLLYAAVLALCYAPVLFAGKTLQAPLYTTSGVIADDPRGSAGRPMVNTFDLDMATPAFYEWPINRYIGGLLRRGELPLWNPHQAAGTPLVVNYSTRVFFPYQMLVNVSPSEVWDFLFVLRLGIAGWLTYCFLARAGLRWTAAAVGGLFYMLSGTFTWFINLEQLVNPAMMAPLFFLAVEAFVARPDARRSAYVAGATGLNLLAGQPEVTVYVLLAGGLYGILRWQTAYGGNLRRLSRTVGWAVVGVVLGFALAGPVLLPFAAHLPHAFHLHERGGDMGVRDPAPSILAVALFVPTFFELPTATRVKPDNGRWDYLGGYGGALAVFLLVAGLMAPAWKQHSGDEAPGMSASQSYPGSSTAARAALLFFAGLWGWIVLKNFGVPPFDWIGYLPLLDRVWTPRWAGPTWCLALSVGAAFGLERLLSADARNPAVRARLLLSTMLVAFGVAILAGGTTLRLGDGLAAVWGFVWPGVLGGQGVAVAVVILAGSMLLRLRGASLAVGLLGIGVVERWFPIPRGYAPDWLVLRLIPVALGVLALILLVLRWRRLAAAGAVVAVMAALAMDHGAPAGLPDRRDPVDAPPVVRFLRERAGYDRIMGDRRVIAPNYASVFGLYDVRYVEALAVDWFQRFVAEGLETGPRRWWHALWFTGDPEAAMPDGRLLPGSLERDLRLRLPGYSLLSVRYIVVPRGRDLNNASGDGQVHFPLVYRDDAVVYENPGALPRSYVVGAWESAPDAQAARARVLAGQLNLRSHAVVEGAPAGTGGGDGRAEIVEYSANRVTIDVETSRPALVVLTDTFHPGWRGRVDGAVTQIYRVNGVVRGVFVDQGRHRIEMTFFPLSQGIGLLLGGLALVALILMPLGPSRRIMSGKRRAPVIRPASLVGDQSRPAPLSRRSDTDAKA